MAGPSDERTVETELDRDIGLVGAVALGVGTMIAAGIFVLSGLAVANVGAMAIVAFLLAAIIASFTAFAYAEFAAIYPESGGGYAYVANTFDTDLTYIVGWSMILGYPASAAFYLASFSDWFYRFIAPLFAMQPAIPYWLPGLVILALLVGLNLKGTEESGKFQIVVTALKVALILLFLIGGLRAFDAGAVQASLVENLGAFREIGLTSALVFITFFGFEAIATNAEEIESPGRTVPRAIFISMAAVTVIYTLVVLVVVIAVHDDNFLAFLVDVAGLDGPAAAEEFIRENGEIAMGRAAQYYLGPVGFYIIIVGALFSMLSAANATILAGSRVKLAMSRRSHLPPRFESLHDRLNTPYNAVLLTGGFILAFIGLFTVVFGGGPGSTAELGLPVNVPLIGGALHLGIESIAHFADFMLLAGLIAVNVALVASRRKHPDLDRSFEVPGVPYVPAVAVVANFVLLVNVEPSSFLIGLLAQGVGVLAWVTVVSPAAAEAEEREAPAIVEERTPVDRDYEVLVPIANPDNVDQLMRTARNIAADNDGAVHVLSVVQLPEQTPLSRGHRYDSAQRDVLERAMAVEEGGGDDADEIPVHGTVRIAHHVDRAILHSAREFDCDAILMGWAGGGRHPRRDVVLGSTVDTVVQDAPCDVLVSRVGEDSPSPETILLPTAGGPHAEFAADIARSLARTTGATVEVVSVSTPGSDPDRLTEYLDRTEAVVGRAEDVTVRSRTVDASSVVDGIVDAAGAHDLTIIGATREGLLQRLVFGTIPEAVARRAPGTVIMAKRNVGLTSQIRTSVERGE